MPNTESSPSGFRTPSSASRMIETSYKADLGEVTVGKTDWQNICSKINMIEIKRGIDVTNFLFGGLVSSGVPLLWKLDGDSLPEGWKVFACWLILLVITSALPKNIRPKWMSGSNDTENKLHLDDIKTWVEHINRTDVQTESDTK